MADGEVVRVMALSAFPSPKLIEVAGKFGDLDGIWIDHEHSGLPNQELEVLLMACRAAGLDSFARVAPTDYPTVMRPMEGGASGIMMAQVRSVGEVEQSVRWMKYLRSVNAACFWEITKQSSAANRRRNMWKIVTAIAGSSFKSKPPKRWNALKESPLSMGCPVKN